VGGRPSRSKSHWFNAAGTGSASLSSGASSVFAVMRLTVVVVLREQRPASPDNNDQIMFESALPEKSSFARSEREMRCSGAADRRKANCWMNGRIPSYLRLPVCRGTYACPGKPAMAVAFIAWISGQTVHRCRSVPLCPIPGKNSLIRIWSLLHCVFPGPRREMGGIAAAVVEQDNNACLQALFRESGLACGMGDPATGCNLHAATAPDDGVALSFLAWPKRDTNRRLKYTALGSGTRVDPRKGMLALWAARGWLSLQRRYGR